MKNLLILFFLLNSSLMFGQTPCDNFFTYTFEDTTCMSRINIDTVNYHHNIWQVGHAQKSVFDGSICSTKVIVTDSVNPYPANDTSVFMLRTLAQMGAIYGILSFGGNYYVQTDTLKDYGKIEFSPDRGLTWIDLMKDTAYNASIHWFSPKPTFTGHSYTCKHFDVWITDIGSVFNIHYGDTLLFRFTFISDSVFDNLGGLMFDNIQFADFVEGISETHFIPIKSKIYPNPTSDMFTVEFENPLAETYEISIYDMHSKLMFRENYTSNKIVINANLFKPDVYVYKLTNLKDHKRSWGKFVTAK